MRKKYTQEQLVLTKNYLIVGGDSFIGAAIAMHLRKEGINVTTTTRRACVLGEDKIFLNLAKDDLPDFGHFDVAILCAGITNMAACESKPEDTNRINVDANLKLARHLLNLGCRVIFISSNAIFDGTIKNPHEDSPYHFMTEYGRQKAAAERQLLLLGKGVAILRITKVVAWRLPLFARILNELKTGQTCKVFADLLFCPISINYVCSSLLTLATSQLDGIFHISGDQDMSYADFAVQTALYFGYDKTLIQPTAALSILFKPKYAGLGMQRTTHLLNIYPERQHLLFSKLLIDR